MSNKNATESEGSGSSADDGEQGIPKSATKKKSSKASKPRLTATQKNTNHKDAENKRRNAIRERFTDLSRMVPGAEGQERSEQAMLGKTTDFLKEMLNELRRLESMAEQRGIVIDKKEKLHDNEYGGRNWKQPNLDQYHAAKQKKGKSGAEGDEDDEDDG